MKFTKMHGCGNDYVYVNCLQESISDESKAAVFVSDRHFGIGSDGLILIKPSEIADFQMVMYNADGSRSEMCGNGIRCVAKYVFDYGLTDQTSLSIESMGKVKYIELTIKDGKVETVRVDMGAPELKAGKVPVISAGDQSVNEMILVDDKPYHMTCVSMGNPHAVVFDIKDVAGMDIAAIGPKFENHHRFPRRTNTEFAQVLDRETVLMRVWERGTGETLACGTGCCATAVAAILNGYTDNVVTLKVLGGALRIEWDGDPAHSVFMTGPAETVFDGEIDIEAALAKLQNS